MGCRAVIAAVAAFAFCHAGASPAAAAGPQPRALVIGNATYATLPPLPACTASANAVAAALGRAGFMVTARKDLSNGQMGAAINDFADSLAQAPDTVAVVYVCGYAVGFEGRVFLLPAPAQLRRDTDALTEGVLARYVARSVAAPPGVASLVLLDSAALPDPGSPPALNSVFVPESGSSKGFAAAYGPMQSSGASPMAAGIVAALSPASVTTADVLNGVRTALRETSGIVAVVLNPDMPRPIKGATVKPAIAAEPPPPPAAAPPAAPPPAAPPLAPAAGPSDAATAPLAGTPQSRLRRIQTALRTLGYYDGGIDGVSGPETLAAIRRFQHELHAEMTGQLTDDETKRLLADGR